MVHMLLVRHDALHLTNERLSKEPAFDQVHTMITNRGELYMDNCESHMNGNFAIIRPFRASWAS